MSHSGHSYPVALTAVSYAPWPESTWAGSTLSRSAQRTAGTWQPPLDRPVEEDEVSLAPILGRSVSVIGYGTMGRAQALNLRDSGVTVTVGAREGSVRGELAQNEGFTVLPVAAAVAGGDVVALMLPDEAMAPVFAREVAPHLTPRAALAFAHGFAVAFEEGRGNRGAQAGLAEAGSEELRDSLPVDVMQEIVVGLLKLKPELRDVVAWRFAGIRYGDIALALDSLQQSAMPDFAGADISLGDCRVFVGLVTNGL